MCARGAPAPRPGASRLRKLGYCTGARTTGRTLASSSLCRTRANTPHLIHKAFPAFFVVDEGGARRLTTPHRRHQLSQERVIRVRPMQDAVRLALHLLQ